MWGIYKSIDKQMLYIYTVLHKRFRVFLRLWMRLLLQFNLSIIESQAKIFPFSEKNIILLNLLDENLPKMKICYGPSQFSLDKIYYLRVCMNVIEICQ